MPAPPRRPPQQPSDWTDRDAALATQLELTPGERVAEHGPSPCRCGGSWRYPLLSHARHPLWRCLHCGALHLGAQPIAEDSPPAVRERWQAVAGGAAGGHGADRRRRRDEPVG